MNESLLLHEIADLLKAKSTRFKVIAEQSYFDDRVLVADRPEYGGVYSIRVERV